ncbi:adenylosuccinate synthetase, partial [Pseudodesulfovibrio pelocollis]|uniref:adenylosuccinate synthetase n=1 Tax=Pseudodesulfovibrio pelocollis TaxID=3051432 RepID=UPI00255AA827
NDFERFIFATPDANVVVDSVRTEEQVEHFRRIYRHRVIHIHLTAHTDVLTVRYEEKFSGMAGEFSCYADAQRNRTEKRVISLSKISDIEVDTDKCTDRDVFERAASLLGLYGNSHERLVDVLVGGQYGSEGKGNVAAYIAPEYDYLVRVGGPNAGHKVKTPDGGEFVFRQLPSGTGSCNAKLVIGPGAVVNPTILMKEIGRFKIGVDRLFIDPQAMVISRTDKRFEKNSLKGDISSTASGAGKAAARRIMHRGSAAHPVVLARDHDDFKSYVKPALEVFDDAFRSHSKVLLEGTQGTGLSLYHGYYPHVTSRDTTVSGCLAEAGISAARVRKIVMVCRTYPIRVPNSESGNTSGPMSPDVSREEISKRSGLPMSELSEITSVTNGKRRIGEFDWHLLRKSTALNSPTDVALTFADYLSAENQKARRFEQLTKKTIEFIEEVERFAKAPVSLISTRFHMRSIIDRRSW